MLHKKQFKILLITLLLYINTITNMVPNGRKWRLNLKAEIWSAIFKSHIAQLLEELVGGWGWNRLPEDEF